MTRRLWEWRDEFSALRARWSLELGKELMAAGADAVWSMITAG